MTKRDEHALCRAIFTNPKVACMRCILHIGTEKTATTLIQEWLYNNIGRLSAQGVALSKSTWVPNNRKLAFYFQSNVDEYMKSFDVHSQQERKAYFAEFEEEFSLEMAQLQQSHNTCIFTSGNFHSRLTSVEEIQNLKDFLGRFFDEITVICYFREQSKVRTSLYSTGLKVKITESILDFQKNVSPESHYYNYFTFFGKWKKVFGKAALKPRIFLKDHMVGGDIRRDLLAAVLPEVDPSKLNYVVKTCNVSLSADEAALYRAINSSRDKFFGKYPDPTPTQFKAAVTGLSVLDLETSISDPRQADMYDVFNESNVEFFSRYFGKKENLFTKPKVVSENEVDEKRFGINDMAELLKSVLSRSQIIAIEKDEVDLLAAMATRLHSAGHISSPEAITLLKIANRARPNDPVISSKIDRLRKVK